MHAYELKQYVFEISARGEQDSKPVEELATEQGTLLCKIWADIFRTSEKDINRNVSFFELGGDSIAAINVANNVRVAG